MTEKQKAAREKFKKVVAEAGKLRKKNPSLTQAQAVKQAWAISYSKAGETKKIGAVKKKSAPKKKAASKKVGAVKKDSSASFYKQQKAFEKQKKVNDAINKKFANWKYPVPPVYTGNWTIKTWSDYITKNGAKIGAVKKSAPKKKNAPKKVASKRVTDIHKDSKSHNVNIKVVSGVEYTKSEYLQEIEDVKNEILKQTRDLEKLKKSFKETKDKTKKEYLKNDIGVLKYNFIPHNKRYLASLKSTLKKSI